MIKCDKIFFISDVHFGCRSNSLDWHQSMCDYFDNWFIPVVKNKIKQDDIKHPVLFVLGDIMDNRSSANILILNSMIDIFEKISKVLPIHIIIGNHDIYKKNSTDINSTRVLRHIKNITVYEEPTELELITSSCTKSVFLMPWRKDFKDEEETLRLVENVDYLFCHTDVTGMKYNKYTDVENGLDQENTVKFKKVFSGHIHLRQESSNIYMIGCPYQLTRSDINNKKGLYILDVESDATEFFINEYSPMFVRLKLDDVLEMTYTEFKHKINNNYVDILSDIKYAVDFPFTTLIDSVNNYKKINVITTTESESDDFEMNEDEQTNFNLTQLIDIYVENINYSEKIKSLVTKKIHELYDRAQSGLE